MDEEPSAHSVTLRSEDSRYSDNFFSFIKEVRRELKNEKKICLPLEFIVNIVKLVAIDPNHKFLIKQQLGPGEVDRLRRIVFERIIGMSEISRSIIKMQLEIRAKWMSRDKVVAAFREGIHQKLHPLMTEMRHSVPKRMHHYDVYYGKLIGATICYANMGQDTERSVVVETQDVIEKIFNKEDISLLGGMTPKDREAELMQIICIAVGVRLRMKDSNPGGYGEFFEDLPNILDKRVQDGLKHLQSMKSLNMERLIKYTTAIQKYFLKHFVIRAGRREVSLGMVKARQGLVMVHQLLFYVKDLTEKLGNEEKHVLRLLLSYKAIMSDLQEDLKDPNVPSTVVNPKYIELCEYWQKLLDSNVYVKTLLNLSMELVRLSERELLPMDDFVNDFLSAVNLKVPSEEEFFKFPPSRVELEVNTQGLKKFVNRGDIDPSTMAFAGFCVNSLVRGAGMPVLANPNLGIFTWKNLSFMLSTPEAAAEFSRNPGVVVRRAIRIARRWPELIILLNVEAEAYDGTGQNEADGYRPFFSGMLVSKSSGTQSELHPVPNYIVESYTWNEWELRRRGITLSKIYKRRTHSTQTHWQALKKTAECQTYAPCSVEVQTNQNVYTSTPKTNYYFAGLRGYHCGMTPHIVELTSEIPDDLHCVCMPKKKTDLGSLIEGDKRKKKSFGI